eukprot:TRINITY_DN7183_c0_g1_i2.p1 TRINITY_DN7183_c0_g1~~TRINITY_DN7183_c0_g1_i2.p1  ORF type:complete len:321 (-),score=50.96 TRINITY_DN7183_c0_g1_i2:211-1173(-)
MTAAVAVPQPTIGEHHIAAALTQFESVSETIRALITGFQAELAAEKQAMACMHANINAEQKALERERAQVDRALRALEDATELAVTKKQASSAKSVDCTTSDGFSGESPSSNEKSESSSDIVKSTTELACDQKPKHTPVARFKEPPVRVPKHLRAAPPNGLDGPPPTKAPKSCGHQPPPAPGKHDRGANFAQESSVCMVEGLKVERSAKPTFQNCVAKFEKPSCEPQGMRAGAKVTHTSPTDSMAVRTNGLHGGWCSTSKSFSHNTTAMNIDVTRDTVKSRSPPETRCEARPCLRSSQQKSDLLPDPWFSGAGDPWSKAE